MLTRRCTQRQFLMRPDPEINNAFLYCLIEAALQFDIVLLLSVMMSNHQHTPFHDPKGFAIEFTHRFHTHFAKCVNVYRGRSENMWSTDPPSLVELVDIDDLVDKLIYTATNPVKAGLVEKVHHWPGPNVVRSLLEGRVLKARRPAFLFRDDGPMPDEVEILLGIPAELGDHDTIIARVRDGIAAEEERCMRERAATGRRVLGRSRILRQSWRDNPDTYEASRGIRPRVAARNKWARIGRIQENEQFQHNYRDCLIRWRAGEDVVFPAGTYWLRIHANVRTESIHPKPTTRRTSR